MSRIAGMPLFESAGPDPASSVPRPGRHGRPRTLERARVFALRAEAAATLMRAFPAVVEGGLTLVVFIGLYRFFRSQTAANVKSFFENLPTTWAWMVGMAEFIALAPFLSAPAKAGPGGQTAGGTAGGGNVAGLVDIIGQSFGLHIEGAKEYLEKMEREHKFHASNVGAWEAALYAAIMTFLVVSGAKALPGMAGGMLKGAVAGAV